MYSPERHIDLDFIARSPELPEENEVSQAINDLQQLESKISRSPLRKGTMVLAHLREIRTLLYKEME